ncbi:dihydropteroate synthase, partial [Streptomyces sp. NPDC127092]
MPTIIAPNSVTLVGILNVTPDSFSDGGRFEDVSVAIGEGLQMQQDGASLIDVG